MDKINLDNIYNIISNHESGFLNIKRKTAVLIPLIKVDGEVNVLFERRSAMIRQPHDISFPGGHQEDSETLQQTAVRETCEELGVPEENVVVYGRMVRAISFSGLYAEAYVGELRNITLEELNPDPMEVENVVAIPLKILLEMKPDEYVSEIISVKSIDFPYHLIENGRNYPFFSGKDKSLFYVHDKTVIWGYTANLLHYFLETIRD